MEVTLLRNTHNTFSGRDPGFYRSKWIKTTKIFPKAAFSQQTVEFSSEFPMIGVWIKPQEAFSMIVFQHIKDQPFWCHQGMSFYNP